MISKLPPINVLKQAIRNLDSTQLSKDDITTLRTNCPTEEEYDLVKAEDSSGTVWDKPEKFVLEVGEIPKLKKRLGCWRMKMTLDDLLEDIAPPLVTLEMACKEMKKSNALKTLLGILLALGNYLNGGNAARGQADGFTFDALDKMHDVKDANNKTLFQHAVTIVQKAYPAAMPLAEELPSVSQASKVSLNDVSNNLQRVQKDLHECRTAYEDIISSTDDKDPFIQIMARFLSDADNKVNNLKKRIEEVEQGFQDLTVFFGTAPAKAKDLTTSEFFTPFNNLIIQFKAHTAVKAAPRKKMPGMIGKKIVEGDNTDDPMAAIINAIKLGQQARINKNQ